MAKPVLSLQPSEAVVAQAAAHIFAAYVAAGQVRDGQEDVFTTRAVQLAVVIAKKTEDAVQSDGELS